VGVNAEVGEDGEHLTLSGHQYISDAVKLLMETKNKNNKFNSFVI
jgi:hypothetical protein